MKTSYIVLGLVGAFLLFGGLRPNAGNKNTPDPIARSSSANFQGRTI